MPPGKRRAKKAITSNTTSWRKNVVRILKAFVGGAAAVGLAGYLFTRLKKGGIKNENQVKALVNETIKKIPAKAAVKKSKRMMFLKFILVNIIAQIIQLSLLRKGTNSYWEHKFQNIGNTTPSATWTRRHAGVRWANEHGKSLTETRVFKPDPLEKPKEYSFIGNVWNRIDKIRRRRRDNENVPIDPKWKHIRI